MPDALSEVFVRTRMYRVNDIAKALGVRRQYASRLVQAMGRAGFQVLRIGAGGDPQRATPFVPGGALLDYLAAQAEAHTTPLEREAREARRIGRKLAMEIQ